MTKYLLASLLAAAAASQTYAQHPQPGQAEALASSGPYAPYDWLIGDWSSKAGIRELITYGPRRSYIRFSAFVPGADGSEHLHFEGIALWNAKTRMLDYLFALEPGSGAQENGTYRAEADGTIIREVELINARGGTGTFRQTFRKTGPNTAVTSVMRQTDQGWVPTFPGGERIELERKPS